MLLKVHPISFILECIKLASLILICAPICALFRPIFSKSVGYMRRVYPSKVIESACLVMIYIAYVPVISNSVLVAILVTATLSARAST